MMLASGVDPSSAGVFRWGCLLLPNLLMMLASAFDAGSAGVFRW